MSILISLLQGAVVSAINKNHQQAQYARLQHQAETLKQKKYTEVKIKELLWNYNLETAIETMQQLLQKDSRLKRYAIEVTSGGSIQSSICCMTEGKGSLKVTFLLRGEYDKHAVERVEWYLDNLKVLPFIRIDHSGCPCVEIYGGATVRDLSKI